MKIKTKLFLVNVILVITLFTSITYLLVARSSDTILKNVKQNASVTLSQISQNLDQKLNSYEQIANTMYLNLKLQDALLTEYSGPREAYQVYFDVIHPFVSIVRTTQDIRNLYFYTPNPSFVFSNVLYLSDYRKERAEWLAALKQTPSGNLWVNSGLDRVLVDDDVFSLKQRLNYTDTATNLAVSIEVNKQVLYNLVNQESMGKQIIITLPSGEVLLDTHGAPDSAFLHKYPFYDELTVQSDTSEFQVEIDGETFIVFHRTLNTRNLVRGMRVIMLVSLQDLLPEIERTRNLSFLLLAVSCVVSALMIYIFASGMMRRLTELSWRMREVQQDHNFSTQIAVKGRDEISQLGNIFNRMVRHLDELIHEVYKGEIDRRELELRIKEAELYALQTQINPHFLYNVLNSIRGNLLERGDIRNAEIVSLLAKSFRILLKSRGEVVSLSEESELVSVYLRIQEYRFGGRLAFHIDVPDRLKDVKVPTMSLQPIVENAVTHVMERTEEVTRVSIHAREVGESIIVTVGDNGTGMTKERLAEIRGWLTDVRFEPREAHFGLWNVHQRLIKLFGPESGLKVESGPGGTEVTLIIPRSYEEVQSIV
jgi:two-component system sensor histidine kinase YesM